jgi:hypothetical protein
MHILCRIHFPRKFQGFRNNETKYFLCHAIGQILITFYNYRPLLAHPTCFIILFTRVSEVSIHQLKN